VNLDDRVYPKYRILCITNQRLLHLSFGTYMYCIAGTDIKTSNERRNIGAAECVSVGRRTTTENRVETKRAILEF
jgi:hypothetical protein